MKKVLIAQDLKHLLQRENSFFSRADIQVLTAGTNDDLLDIHRSERVDLIITHLDLPGMSPERATARIREDAELRTVQLIMICANNRSAIEQCSRCRPNAVFLRPVNPSLLLSRAQRLLDISSRETSRLLITVSVEGSAEESIFFCQSRDVSASGMLIETDKTLPPGSRVVCSFSLPDSTRIQAAGEIVRSPKQASGNLHLYGVKFVSLSSEEQTALETFIDKKSRKDDPHLS